MIKSKVALIVDSNTHMRNDRVYGLHHLNPLDVASALLVTMHHLSECSVATFASTDKINKFNLNEKQAYPDLTSFESIFQGVSRIFIF